jgi:hypothetical protein
MWLTDDSNLQTFQGRAYVTCHVLVCLMSLLVFYVLGFLETRNYYLVPPCLLQDPALRYCYCC